MPEDSALILDVGHGSAALFFLKGRTLLVDAGPGSAILELLLELKVKTLDLVLVTHADADHIGGIIAILASGEIRIERVILNSDATKGSGTWETMLVALDVAQKAGMLSFEIGLSTGSTKALREGGWDVEVVAPSSYLAAKSVGSDDKKGRRITSNALSAVLRVSSQGKPMALVAGDIEGVGLANLMESGVACPAPILVFPHHGARPGSANEGAFTQSLLRLVSPTYVAFSNGRLRYDAPRPAIIEAIRREEKPPRIVCTQLSKRCSAGLPASDVQLSPFFAAGRERGLCCGGTLSFVSDDATSWGLSNNSAHTTFVKGHATHAMCLGKGDALPESAADGPGSVGA